MPLPERDSQPDPGLCQGIPETTSENAQVNGQDFHTPGRLLQVMFVNRYWYRSAC